MTLKNKSRYLQLVIALIITSVFLFLVFRRVDPAQLWRAILSARIGWVVVGILACGADLTIRTSRWWWMLRKTQPDVRWSDCFAPFLGCLALNNLLPFRAGDVVRTVAFRDRLKVTSSTLLASLVTERILDAATLLGLLAAFLPMIGKDTIPGNVRTILAVVGVMTIVLILSLFIALAPIRRIAELLIESRFVSERPKLKSVCGYADGVLSALADVISFHNVGLLIVMSLAGWFLEGMIFYAVASSLDIQAPAVAPWISMTLASLATLIPSAPGYVGTYHFFAALGLTSFDVPNAPATAFAFISHGILFLTITIWGGTLLFRSGRSYTLKSINDPLR
jgi:uncharacterized protein (TIRG00374 family)